jgi:hypothetical protein
MKKESTPKKTDSLRKEYDLSKLGPGVRGKYFARATAGINIVRIEPDLAKPFPDGAAVNRALRVLADAVEAVGQSTSRRGRSR